MDNCESIREVSKYYTPTIDEFYVGFEYEWKYKDSNSEFNYGKLTFDDIVFSKQLEDILNGEVITRVKMLDKYDIYSLYWLGDKFRGNPCFSKAPAYKLFWFEEAPSSITISWIMDIEETQLEIQLFRGHIKNKSELIRLMKQLNIH